MKRVLYILFGASVGALASYLVVDHIKALQCEEEVEKVREIHRKFVADANKMKAEAEQERDAAVYYANNLYAACKNVVEDQAIFARIMEEADLDAELTPDEAIAELAKQVTVKEPDTKAAPDSKASSGSSGPLSYNPPIKAKGVR